MNYGNEGLNSGIFQVFRSTLTQAVSAIAIINSAIKRRRSWTVMFIDLVAIRGDVCRDQSSVNINYARVLARSLMNMYRIGFNRIDTWDLPRLHALFPLNKIVGLRAGDTGASPDDLIA